MSDKDRIPAEVFILFKLEGLKTALSDSPLLHKGVKLKDW